MEKPLTFERAGTRPPPPLKGGMPRRTPALQCVSSLCLLNKLKDKTFLFNGGYKPSNTQFINKYSITLTCLHDLSSQDCPYQTRQIEGRFKCCYCIQARRHRAAPVPSCRGGTDEADQAAAGKAMTFILIHTPRLLHGLSVSQQACSAPSSTHSSLAELGLSVEPYLVYICLLPFPKMHNCKVHV